MEYKIITAKEMRTDLEDRILLTERQHYAATITAAEFDFLGKEYAELRAVEEEKIKEFERLLSFLYSKLEDLF